MNLSFEIEDTEDLDVKAYLGGRPIGHAWCVRDGGRLKIEDLGIEASYRGKGHGSALLKFVLRTAADAGVGEVWGIVTKDDLTRKPDLVEWYEAHGFTSSEPDADTDPRFKAVRKITRGFSDSARGVAV